MNEADAHHSPGGREAARVAAVEDCRRRPILRDLAVGLLLVLLVCTLYTAAASALLFLFLRREGNLEDPGQTLRVFYKAAGACAMALALGAALWRLAGRARPPEPETVAEDAPARLSWIWCAAFALVFSFLFLPHLGVYPWAAPDEMHHLLVAKNLAEHGEYASGDPEAGFKRFDPFDSVGPPVIVPVAGAFRVAGANLAAARVVIAAYFLALCAAAYFLIRGMYGAPAGMWAASLVPAAFSSIYLGRTVYGEAPALFHFVLALLLWRAALRRERAIALGLGTGLAWGLAVLCKTIFVLTAVPIAVAVVYDWMAWRRVRVAQAVLPALGAAAVLGCWFAVQALFQRTVAENAGGTVGLYRHYLQFGVQAGLSNLPYLIRYPWTHLVLACSALWVLAAVVRRRYDPALLALLLTGALYAYWWCFFTPGRHPRYLWCSYAVLAMCLGPACAQLWRRAHAPGRPRFAAILCRVVVFAMLVPSALWVARQGREVWTNREMADDTALAAYVKALPEQLRIGTTYYPVRGTLMFYTGRRVALLDGPETSGGADVIILHANDVETPGTPAVRIGPYYVWRAP